VPNYRARGLAAAVSGLLIAAVALTPAQAARAPRWRLVTVVSAAFQELAVSATGPNNAWATGDPATAIIERWNGRAWRLIQPPVHLGILNTNFESAPVGSSSAGDSWIFPAVYQGTTPRTVALHWRHGHWTTYQFPRNSLIADTAVFSPADAWAFGTLSHSRHLTPYDLRYNGRRWRAATLPGAPHEVSALSPANLWAIGPSIATLNAPASKQITLAMHWNGRAWSKLRVPVPPGPSGGFLDDRIAAAGARNLWYAYFRFDRNSNFISNGLLHWYHGRWHRLRLPSGFNFFLNSAAQDGAGGLWICAPDSLYHYSNGQWAEQIRPGEHFALNALAWIPGTKSAWAVGEGARGHGIILRYVP
jgi:hypothetical protein